MYRLNYCTRSGVNAAETITACYNRPKVSDLYTPNARLVIEPGVRMFCGSVDICRSQVKRGCIQFQTFKDRDYIPAYCVRRHLRYLVTVTKHADHNDMRLTI